MPNKQRKEPIESNWMYGEEESESGRDAPYERKPGDYGASSMEHAPAFPQAIHQVENRQCRGSQEWKTEKGWGSRIKEKPAGRGGAFDIRKCKPDGNKRIEPI